MGFRTTRQRKSYFASRRSGAKRATRVVRIKAKRRTGSTSIFSERTTKPYRLSYKVLDLKYGKTKTRKRQIKG